MQRRRRAQVEATSRQKPPVVYDSSWEARRTAALATGGCSFSWRVSPALRCETTWGKTKSEIAGRAAACGSRCGRRIETCCHCKWSPLRQELLGHAKLPGAIPKLGEKELAVRNSAPRLRLMVHDISLITVTCATGRGELISAPRRGATWLRARPAPISSGAPSRSASTCSADVRAVRNAFSWCGRAVSSPPSRRRADPARTSRGLPNF